MPGSIHISATQPPATPLFLQVVVGKREYNGNIEQDGLSFPVTSLRETMVIMLYNADRELISKTELQAKTIVESGTIDAVFTLDSGEEVILQLQFLLSDDDRKRIQEMRSSAMKRKQRELLGDSCELNFPDSPLSRRIMEKISNIESKRDQSKLQKKSLSLGDLQGRVTFSGIDVDPHDMKASRDLLLQISDGGKFEGSGGSKEGRGKPESRSSSAVKKMISAFESTSSWQQGFSSTETGASVASSSGRNKETGKAKIEPLGDKGWNERSRRKQASFLVKAVQNGAPNASSEYRSRRPSGGGRKQKTREQEELSRSRRRSEQAKHRRPFSLEQVHSTRSNLDASRELKDLLELEQQQINKHAEKPVMTESTFDDKQQLVGGGSPVLNLNLNGWLIHEGVRAAIVVIACGAVFLSNR